MTRAERRGSFLRRADTSETAPRGELVTAMISATTPARVRAVVHSSTRAVVCSRVSSGRMVEGSMGILAGAGRDEEAGELPAGDLADEVCAEAELAGAASSICFLMRIIMSSREKW